MGTSIDAAPRDPPAEGGPIEAADFIAGSLEELARMARRHGHDTLGYLLDVALLEATNLLDRSGRPGDQRSDTIAPP